MTDSINIAGDNKKLGARYYELIKPQKKDNRSGDEIAQDLIERLGLKVE